MSIRNTFTRGVLIDVFVSCWTGEKQLTAEDLGIKPEKLSKAFKLGKKTLIPKDILKKFKHHDYLVRKLLLNSGFTFPFGGARFVPKTKVEEFIEAFDVLKTSFEADVRDLENNYTKYRREMRTEFIDAAKEAYSRYVKIYGVVPGEDPVQILNPEAAETPNPELRTPSGDNEEETKALTESEFVNNFLERIEKCYPHADKIAGKYGMAFEMWQMELPDLAEASIDDVAEEATKLTLIQKAYHNKMRKTLEEYAQKIVEENRARVGNVVDAFKESLTKGKKITVATLRSMEEAIKNFGSMDVANDANLKNHLNTFKVKYLETKTAKNIRESSELQKAILADLQALAKVITDASEISALAEAYRKETNQ